MEFLHKQQELNTTVGIFRQKPKLTSISPSLDLATDINTEQHLFDKDHIFGHGSH